MINKLKFKKADRILVQNQLSGTNFITNDMSYLDSKKGDVSYYAFTMPKVGDKVRLCNLAYLKMYSLIKSKANNDHFFFSPSGTYFSSVMQEAIGQRDFFIVKEVTSSHRIILEGNIYVWEPYWMNVIEDSKDTYQTQPSFYEFKTEEKPTSEKNPISLQSGDKSKFKIHTHYLIKYLNSEKDMHGSYVVYDQWEIGKESEMPKGAEILTTFYRPKVGDKLIFRGFDRLEKEGLFNPEIPYDDVLRCGFNAPMREHLNKMIVWSVEEVHYRYHSIGSVVFPRHGYTYRPCWFEALND